MASPADTLSSCSNQRGVPRRSWNGRERDSWKCRRRSSSVPRSIGQHESITRSRSIERHEEPTRTSGSCSRMRVGVRVRPAFEIEVQRHPEARGGYSSAVVVDGQGRIELRTNGRQRCFPFDYAFDATCQQHEIYERYFTPPRGLQCVSHRCASESCTSCTAGPISNSNFVLGGVETTVTWS